MEYEGFFRRYSAICCVVVADAGVLHLAYRFMRLWYALFIQLAYNRNTNTPMTGKYCCFSLFLLCAHKYSRTHISRTATHVVVSNKYVRLQLN